SRMPGSCCKENARQRRSISRLAPPSGRRSPSRTLAKKRARPPRKPQAAGTAFLVLALAGALAALGLAAVFLAVGFSTAFLAAGLAAAFLLAAPFLPLGTMTLPFSASSATASSSVTSAISCPRGRLATVLPHCA